MDTVEDLQTLVEIGKVSEPYEARSRMRPVEAISLQQVLGRLKNHPYGCNNSSRAKRLDQSFYQGFVMLHIFRQKVLEAALYSNVSLPMHNAA